MKRWIGVVPVAVLLLVMATEPAFASSGNSFDAGMQRVVVWLQGRAASIAVVILVIGACLLMFGPRTEKHGMRIIWVTLIGIVLVVAAPLIVGGLVSFVAAAGPVLVAGAFDLMHSLVFG